MASNSDRLNQQVARRAEQGGAPAKPAYASIEGLIKKYEAEIVNALPGHVAGEQFLRLILQEFRLNPKLIECSPASILGGVFTCARLGMEPGPLGLLYLVPRKNKGVVEMQVQIGYKGYVQLAYRTDMVNSILPYTINEHDEFEWHGGTDNNMVHHMVDWQNRGKVLGYYVVIRMKDGTNVVSRPWSVGEIEAHRRKHSQIEGGGLTPAWRISYDVMASKTVLRDMIRWMPLSTEMLSLTQVDGATVKALPKPGDGAPELVELVHQAEYPEIQAQDDGTLVNTGTGEVLTPDYTAPEEPLPVTVGETADALPVGMGAEGDDPFALK
jgi:recombination protein RecT